MGPLGDPKNRPRRIWGYAGEVGGGGGQTSTEGKGDGVEWSDDRHWGELL